MKNSGFICGFGHANGETVLYLSLIHIFDFVKVQYGVELPAKDIACIFSDRNKQCLGSACPFFAG